MPRKPTIRKQNTGAATVIYARYSTHNQKDASIEQQVDACRKYAKDFIKKLNFYIKNFSFFQKKFDFCCKKMVTLYRAIWELVYAIPPNKRWPLYASAEAIRLFKEQMCYEVIKTI